MNSSVITVDKILQLSIYKFFSSNLVLSHSPFLMI